MKPTRGERNNNPFNIREFHGCGHDWQGERATDDDQEFEEFTAAVFGIRAGCKVLLTYYRKHGLNTVEGIISRFAPGTENDTEAYIAAVSGALGVSRIQEINVKDINVLTCIAKAIIRHENGRVVYSDDEIRQAAEAACL